MRLFFCTGGEVHKMVQGKRSRVEKIVANTLFTLVYASVALLILQGLVAVDIHPFRSEDHTRTDGTACQVTYWPSSCY